MPLTTSARRRCVNTNDMSFFLHSKPDSGILEGTLFTDGSSSGLGALRRAGWALVATNAEGQLISAAYAAVPLDVRPGQSSRDGEDHHCIKHHCITPRCFLGVVK